MRSGVGRLVRVCGVALVAAVAVEALGVAWYRHTDGTWFYLRDRTGARAPAPPASPLRTLRIHPYLGFVLPAGMPLRELFSAATLDQWREGETASPDWLDLRVNGAGFLSAVEYPYVGKPDDFVVGIFGGDAADRFSRQGRRRLIERLREIDRLHGRDIVVLNFALPAGKQPQQVQALGFFLSLGQRFDYVVNLDGVNEVVAGLRNLAGGADAGMPSCTALAPLFGALGVLDRDPAALAKLSAAIRARDRRSRIERWRTETRSAGLHLLLGCWLQGTDDPVVTDPVGDGADPATTKFDPPYYAIAPAPAGLLEDDPAALTRLLDQWANASLLMKQMTEAQGGRYLEVIQPFPRSDLAGARRSPADLRGRPEFVRSLCGAGIDARSAVALFDEPGLSAGADASGDGNQRGNDRLADFVADAMTASLGGEAP